MTGSALPPFSAGDRISSTSAKATTINLMSRFETLRIERRVDVLQINPLER